MRLFLFGDIVLSSCKYSLFFSFSMKQLELSCSSSSLCCQKHEDRQTGNMGRGGAQGSRAYGHCNTTTLPVLSPASQEISLLYCNGKKEVFSAPLEHITVCGIRQPCLLLLDLAELQGPGTAGWIQHPKNAVGFHILCDTWAFLR